MSRISSDLGDPGAGGAFHVIAVAVIEVQIVGGQVLGPVGAIRRPIISLLYGHSAVGRAFDMDDHLGPAEESIASAGRNRDVHAFVDFQRPNLGGRAVVVLEPIDVLSRGGSFDVGIGRPQLHCVLISVTAGHGFRDRFDLGKCSLDHKGLAIGDLDVGVLILRSIAVPLLHYPVGELLAGGRSVDGRRGQSMSAIDIEVGIESRAGAAV